MAPLVFSRTLLLLPLLFPSTAFAIEDVPRKDQIALMAEVKKVDRVGVARKTKEVDARPASPGEIVITYIKGQGVETRSKPAEEGDWVVRNRCEETGNEEILVKARNFSERYGEPLSAADAAGYRAFKPKGNNMSYFIVTDEIGPFNFRAPWDETMVALPGDAIVQVQTDESDTYRVAAAAFQCTYEIVDPAKFFIDASLR
ncbi:hypothetical protein DSM25558_1507 [Agrobacterium sp. DSM 25558]|uniref:Uncharacterized protein n=1 Tax=Agrobacterium rosae TaxID=1972867 RepID=A0A1R3TR22_9HYPH|nr:hypothetical protein [Agrobacterium rosae]SCX11539.1 hypothetical protein DSM25558_1507 [Agrobacterium sp. DSM 25558]SCX23453.1 hypothetical protein DSM25559_2399 [Agrobacterium rosae]